MIKPVRDYLLIKVVDKGPALPVGMILPEGSKLESNEATVVEVGPQVDLPNASSPGTTSSLFGMTVIFNKWGGIPVKDNGVDYLLIQAKDIFGVKTTDMEVKE